MPEGRNLKFWRNFGEMSLYSTFLHIIKRYFTVIMKNNIYILSVCHPLHILNVINIVENAQQKYYFIIILGTEHLLLRLMSAGQFNCKHKGENK